MKQWYSQESIKQRTDAKIITNIQKGKHTCIVNKREYVVFADVFSPAVFVSTEWFTNSLIKHLGQVQSFLEIGTGAGVTLTEVLLSKVSKNGLGSDINPQAVLNTKANLQSYGLECPVVLSNVLQNIDKQERFEAIYWNYPFHLKSDKPYEQLNNIEKSIRDPNYIHLDKLLKSACNFMKEKGRLFLGFSETMGNKQRLQQLLISNQWKYSILQRTEINTTLQSPSVCLIELRKQ